MYNDEILDKEKTIIEQCDIAEHKLVFKLIKMRNEIVLMGDIEWKEFRQSIGKRENVLYSSSAVLPAAKTINMICSYYTCNKQIGLSYLKILTKDQLNIIRKKQQKGGVK